MAALMPGEITRKRDSDYHYHVRNNMYTSIEPLCIILELKLVIERRLSRVLRQLREDTSWNVPIITKMI